jgi:hypothetical protein
MEIFEFLTHQLHQECLSNRIRNNDFSRSVTHFQIAPSLARLTSKFYWIYVCVGVYVNVCDQISKHF